MIDSPQDHGRHIIYLAAILLLALSARFYVWVMSPVFNPDGVIYIYQAKALYYGNIKELTGCGVNFFSVYPLLIYLFHFILGDWEVSARMVSILFGAATVVPVYMIVLRFVDLRSALITALIAAVIPVAAGTAGQIVRDHVAWCFVALGLVFFLKHRDEHRMVSNLILSSGFFLLAAWGRAEAVSFTLLSLCYLAVKGGPHRVKKIAFFSLPIIALTLAGLIAFYAAKFDIGQSFRIASMTAIFDDLFDGYTQLRTELEYLAIGLEGRLRFFVAAARQNIWSLALVLVVVNVIRGLSYFYGIFILFGLKKYQSENGIKTGELTYIHSLIIFGLMMLYMHTVRCWVMDVRFVMVVILPSLVLAGMGIERLIGTVTKRGIMSVKAASVLVIGGVLFVGAGNIVRFSEKDKLVFRQIGYSIAENAANGRPIAVVASQHIKRWVAYYANSDVDSAVCPEADYDFADIIGSDYDALLRNLKSRAASYLVWEEKNWPTGAFDLSAAARAEDMVRLGSWYHPDTGRMILFKCALTGR